MNVILIKNGVVENVICADSLARAQQFFPSYTCVERTAGMSADPGDVTTDNVTFTPPARVPYKTITRFAMLNRFTPAELTAINAARQGTGAGPAQMEALWQNLSTASYIHLSAPQLSAMMDQLVSAGILTSARATQILTTPAAQAEMPGGV